MSERLELSILGLTPFNDCFYVSSDGNSSIGRGSLIPPALNENGNLIYRY